MANQAKAVLRDIFLIHQDGMSRLLGNLTTTKKAVESVEGDFFFHADKAVFTSRRSSGEFDANPPRKNPDKSLGERGYFEFDVSDSDAIAVHKAFEAAKEHIKFETTKFAVYVKEGNSNAKIPTIESVVGVFTRTYLKEAGLVVDPGTQKIDLPACLKAKKPVSKKKRKIVCRGYRDMHTGMPIKFGDTYGILADVGKKGMTAVVITTINGQLDTVTGPLSLVTPFVTSILPPVSSRIPIVGIRDDDAEKKWVVEKNRAIPKDLFEFVKGFKKEKGYVLYSEDGEVDYRHFCSWVTTEGQKLLTDILTEIGKCSFGEVTIREDKHMVKEPEEVDEEVDEKDIFPAMDFDFSVMEDDEDDMLKEVRDTLTEEEAAVIIAMREKKAKEERRKQEAREEMARLIKRQEELKAIIGS